MGLLLLATLIPIPGNFKVKIVKSGSMEPTIMTGGIVVIRPASVYKVGDIVTFGPDTKTQIPTTHRIVDEKSVGNGVEFTTKGDANDTADPKAIKLSDVDGKVMFSVPFIGYILDFAKKPIGFLLLVGVPAAIVIFDEILKIFSEVRRMRRKRSNLFVRESFREDPEAKEGSNPRRSYPTNQSNYRQGNVLDLRKSVTNIAPQASSVAMSNRAYSLRAMSAVLIIIGPLLGLGRVGNTISYYNENESSQGNILQASNDFGNNTITDTTDPGTTLRTVSLVSDESFEVTEDDTEVGDEESTTSITEVINEDSTTTEHVEGGDEPDQGQTEEPGDQHSTEEVEQSSIEEENNGNESVETSASTSDAPSESASVETSTEVPTESPAE